MKHKSKIIIAQMLAGILAFSFVGTSCDGTTPGGGYVETGMTVKFDYNDGKARPLSLVVEEGEQVQTPDIPVKEGAEFVQWQTEKDGGEVITFPYTPTKDITLYAAWKTQEFTVTFDMNCDEGEDIVSTVPYEGEVQSAPDQTLLPVRNGYEFFAWQDAPEGGETVTFPYKVLRDTTFYAVWTSGGIYTIDIDVNYEGGGEYEALKVLAGDDIKKREMPANPKRDGYNFLGWSTNANATTEEECISFPYEPTANGTLYAVWEMKTYSVNFRYNYVGKPSKNYTQITGLHIGDELVKPEVDPTRPGHTFDGWYTTAQGGTPVDFTKPVSNNATYYAHWKSDKVVTDTFHAEFTEFDPTEEYPGYSGEALGAGIITGAGSNIQGLIHNDSDYPTNEAYDVKEGHFVTFLYKRGATVTFKIYATQATSVTLQANLATEYVTNVTVGPTGSYAWKLKVNGDDVAYTPIDFKGQLIGTASAFQLYTLGTIDLKAGENTISFITDNDNPAGGGAMKAFAPMIDCIKLTGSTGELSYHPIYDNLWYGELG